MTGFVLAVAIVLLVIGSLAFHFMSPWQLTPLASQWNDIDLTIDITFWVTGFVFVAVNAFLVYCLFRYRHREGNKADYDPENTRLEVILTSITTVGVIAMLAPGLFAWADFVNVPDDARQVEAMGKQWHWSYRFPGEDGVFGDVAVRHASVDNPFGIDPEDPAGQDDLLIMQPILHLPVDENAHVLLRSTDVLHNFTVPQFRVKMDLVPGMVTYQWFRPTEVGTYDVLCEEHCGVGHFAMRSRVVVEPRADFEAWLNGQPTFAQTQARPLGNATAGAAMYGVCAACHGAQGEGNQALNAPKLAGQEGWYIRRQIANYQNGLRGASADDVAGMQMAPMARTLATPAALENVIAYIETLPDAEPATTITGNAARGAELYQSCAVCHGNEGEGRWNTNAPRLANMSDWYLANQLVNFKNRVRGGHADDIYGDQMYMISTSLITDQAIEDVIAYINTL
ncbi:MAG: c-type cytochrome [Gammaproteobacteria bacterium]|jgi:cytochrome c oxidase subunit 2